jgi:nitroreductase
MNELEAILARHSVRAYTDKLIPLDIVKRLEDLIGECNAKSGLHIQLVRNEPKAFGTWKARYGHFVNVKNYIAIIGPDTLENYDEICGYYGQRIVLAAQMEGLNTCWVAMNFSRKRTVADIAPGDKIAFLIACGYGQTQGSPRTTRPLASLCSLPGGMRLEETPEWFRAGIQAASLAPTAVNTQNFLVTLHDDLKSASIEPTSGPYAKTDAGIAKYNFEVGAGRDSFTWR